jgi:PAS domain S-box-containing protein
MESLQFALNPYSFVSVPLFILGLASTLYLFRIEEKTAATWSLIGVIGSFTLGAVAMFVTTFVILWGVASWPAQDAFVVFGMAAMILFVYYFPERDRSLIARLALLFGIGASTLALGYSVYFAYQILVHRSFELQAPAAYPFLMPLAFLVALVVSIRRTIHVHQKALGRSDGWRRAFLALWRPQGRCARVLRNFSLALSLGLLQGLASGLSAAGLVPLPLDVYAIGFSLLLMVVAIVYATFEHADQQPSLIVKLVGFSLVTLLAILGAVGLFETHAATVQSDKERVLQVEIVHRAILSGDLTALPGSVAYVSQDERLVYARDVDIVPLAEETRWREIEPPGPVWSYYTELFLRWNKSPEQIALRYGAHPVGSVYQYVGYLFVEDGAEYEVGFSLAEMAQSVHNEALLMTAVVLLSSLFIVLIFPLFFRANLVKPLDKLLEGVRQVNAGDLDVSVPIAYQDEVGFLTRSFNNMTASIKIEIAERQRAEAEARESEARFRTLFEHAPLCIFEMDSSQTPPAILRANRQAEQVYGWSSEEFVGMPINRMFSSHEIPHLAQVEGALRAGETVTLESVSQRRDGSVFPVRISASPEAAPNASPIILTIEEITAEKARRSEEEAIAEERRRIAREIHDGLAQALASLRLRADVWHTLVDRDPSKLHAELDRLQEILGAGIREVRRSIFALRPVALEELGFYPALQQFINDFGEQNQLRVDLRILGSQDRLPASLEPVLFRIIQEALNNVGKHAQASTVWIELDLESASEVVLQMRDDGVGFDLALLDQAVRNERLGLKHMRERVENLRGTFRLHSQSGEGMEIQLAIPMGSKE